ncbi:MAG: hypothetical protein VB078_07005 [Clostridiaceae bacterium]|nr:hypothetical protein [Clostridiaceae bacterium]
MANEINKQSILRMAMGAIEERVDYEVSRVVDNIIDVNTKASAKRKITVTLELAPDDERRTITVRATAKATLVPTNPVATALYITTGNNGEMVIAELTPQAPGQIAFSGEEQEAPKILKLANIRQA